MQLLSMLLITVDGIALPWIRPKRPFVAAFRKTEREILHASAGQQVHHMQQVPTTLHNVIHLQNRCLFINTPGTMPEASQDTIFAIS